MDPIRTGLRNDFGQFPGAARLRGAIPVLLDGDCLTGQSLPAAESRPDPDPGGWYPRFTLRTRTPSIVDDDGIQQWDWATYHQGEVAMRDVTRTEVSDAAGQVLVRAVIEVPAPEDTEPPRETSTAWDEDGNRWNVTALDNQGAVWVLMIERVDDGS